MAELLALDVPAHLGTVDPDGFPRVTPIWFLWDEDARAFRMTSFPWRPHVRNLQHNPKAALGIDDEARIAVQGHRANRQVKVQAIAALADDADGTWTRRITRKYVPGADAERWAEWRAARGPRVLITLPAERLVRIGTPTRPCPRM